MTQHAANIHHHKRKQYSRGPYQQREEASLVGEFGQGVHQPSSRLLIPDGHQTDREGELVIVSDGDIRGAIVPDRAGVLMRSLLLKSRSVELRSAIS